MDIFACFHAYVCVNLCARAQVSAGVPQVVREQNLKGVLTSESESAHC